VRPPHARGDQERVRRRTANGERNGAIDTNRIKGGSAKRNGADLELTAAGKASVEYP